MTSGALRVKAPVLLLLALIVACLGIAFMPASAHAEGFFSRTVKCLFAIPLLSSCQTQSPAPVAPAETPSSQPSKQTTTKNNTTQSTQSNSTPREEVSNPSQPVVTGDPLEMPEVSLQPHAPLVQPGYGGSLSSSGSGDYIASTAALGAFTTNPQPRAATDEAFLARSETGWKIAGTPWFLWAIGILGLIGIITSVRRINLSKNSLLPKA